MSVRQRFAELMQRFVPPELARDPEASRRAQLTVGVACALMILCPSFAALSFTVYRLPAIGVVDLCATVVAAAVPFVLRATRSLRLASSLALLVTVAAITLAAVSVEGLTSPALVWLLAVPILASLLGGRRGAVSWALVCMVAIVAMLVFDRYLPNQELPAATRRLGAAWNFILTFSVVAAFAAIYERMHERSQAALAAAQVELDKAREQALLADRLAALARLAAGVAHEINNPSAFVAGNVRLARDTIAQVRAGVTPSSELQEVEAALSDALSGAVRITETVRDLKTLGRAADERTAIIDVAEMMDVSLRLVSPQLRDKVTVEKHLSALAPIVANESRLGQVFVNLLTNAIDAMPARPAGQSRLRVAVRNDGSHVTVEISDNGIGIAPETLPHIFEPFFTTKQVGQGSGLGLSISRTLVEQMHGTIEVESKRGLGSTFRLRFPAVAPVVSEKPVAASAGPSRRLKVLVIDDEPLICQALQRLLGRTHDVETLTSAVEALSRGRLDSYDVILCDLMMPGVSGVDFYERVVKEWPQLAGRIGFLSGGQFSARVRAHADLFSARLVDKPFETEKLNALVTALSRPGRTTPKA